MVVAERCRVYEQESVRAVTGPAIRPGGLELTRTLLARSELPAGAAVLDVGCGPGATVEYLTGLGFAAIGLDPSLTLLQAGQERAPGLTAIQSPGECLPLAAGQFAAVLAECSLSLMGRPAAALAEFARVLRPGGRLLLSDLYLRQPAVAPALRRLPLACCLTGAMSQNELLALLDTAGFTLLDWADHTAALKYFTGQLIFAHGSLAEFWGCITGGPVDGAAISAAKPGYFALIAAKKEDLDGR